MPKSYSSKVIKIYFWQALSILLNFASLFVIIPFLSADPSIYGIYTLSVTFSVFLSYADLGFLSAGQKYAAEYFSRGERELEIRIIGFTIYILGIVLFLFMLFFLFISLKPELIIRDIQLLYHREIASDIFKILGFFTITTLIQRGAQIVFSIRMEDYIPQILSVIGNSLKVVSVFYFFGDSSSNVIDYVLFSNILNLVNSIILVIIIKYRFNYDFVLLLKSLRFSRDNFEETKSLALVNVVSTIAWIVYYELDTIIIGRQLGLESLAMYSVGTTLLSIFRTLFGVVFAPLGNLFNHFIGRSDEDSLKSIYSKTVFLFAPLVILPIVVLVIFMKPFTIAWLGIEYQGSIQISRALILCNIFAFIAYPTNLLLFGKQRLKELYHISYALPVLYWLLVIITFASFGINSFAVSKFIAFSVAAIYLSIVSSKYLGITIRRFIFKFLGIIAVPVSVSALLSIFIVPSMPLSHSNFNLFLIISVISFILLGAFVLQFISSKYWRDTIKLYFFN